VRRRYIFKKSAVEIIFKEGYSVLMSFPEGNFEDNIKLFFDLVKKVNNDVKISMSGIIFNEKNEFT
jgi:hypothetical protein